MRTHDGPHDGTHDDCYGCRIKSVQIGVGAMPTRRNHVAPRTPDPAWERGRAGERRPDGSFVPYLDQNLRPIGVKQMQNNRSRYERIRRDQLNRPTPLT